MLYLVGLGLADETDITVKGLAIVKRAERVYLEAYTSILLVGKEKLVSLIRLYMENPSRVLLGGRTLRLGRSVGNLLWPTCYTGRPRNGRIVER